MRVFFAEFVLDTATRQLFRGGTAVHVEPKALELLELLVARRPEAVPKSEIHRRLWLDTFVSESSLTGLVTQVRKALGDDRRRERFLRTVHGFGYAFCGELALRPPGEQDPPARLIWEDSVLPLQPGDNLLGRAEEATVRVEAPGVSRRHARIVITGDHVTIEDLGSKNGTFVGERRLDGPAPLRDGDRFRLSFSSSGGQARRPPPGRRARLPGVTPECSHAMVLQPLQSAKGAGAKSYCAPC
jgi:DNA-binding winged helix-turn-helix (wHTH) protein